MPEVVGNHPDQSSSEAKPAGPVPACLAAGGGALGQHKKSDSFIRTPQIAAPPLCGD